MRERQARAARWIRDWDALGSHRTGTAGDQAGAAWLASEVTALGATPTLERFPVNRIDSVACWVSCNGKRIEGVPVFDAPPTSPDGVTGAIAVRTLSPWAVYTPAYREFRSAADHTGLVIVCEGAAPGLALLNAEHFLSPYGAPAIHVAESLPSPPDRIVSHYERTSVEACNIVVTIAGRDRTRPPVVVMTPRSSWWQSASERGGGLVCWLETLRSLLTAQPACDVVMTANSGHELGHLGLDAFLARRPGWDRANGAVWLHFGANIGAAGGTLSLQSADEPLRTAMQSQIGSELVMAPLSQIPNGETRDIHRLGGRYITLVGTNRLFHLPDDRWPDAVDVPAIARTAKAAAAMARGWTSA